MSMPSSNGKTVLVTGINGYIASVLGLHLLSKGYSLRGTTRRVASTEPLINGPYAPYHERVKIYEVPDMTISGAFDEASAGVDGIFHTASPIDFSLETFEQMITPAVRGSETILESALKAGQQLSAIVITSSVVAVYDPINTPHIFTENDFATVSLDRAISDRDTGLKTPAGVLYGASKTAAERAVWAFRDTHKPSFAIMTINPSVVIGPPIFLPKSAAQLNETLSPIFKLLSGAVSEVPPNIGSGGFVDVRDVAKIHTWAFEHPKEANGERYIAAEGFGPMQAAADILRLKFKGTEIEGKIPVGKPGEGYTGYDAKTGEVGHVQYLEGSTEINGQKVSRVMGLEYVEYRKSVEETAEVLKALL